MVRWCVLIMIGEANAAIIFAATCCAPSCTSRFSLPGKFSSITANSSPPSRATVSLARTHAASLAATRLSNSSPTSWPSESLIVLNRSRSINMNARPVRLRNALATPCSSRSLTSIRLGKPVSGSRVAKNSTRSSASLRLVMLAEVPVMRSARPLALRSVTLPVDWSHTHSSASPGARYSHWKSSFAPVIAAMSAAWKRPRSSG